MAYTTFQVYRYDPVTTPEPTMRTYTLDIDQLGLIMVLDGLTAIKEQDPSLAFRRSCREGVCGSDGMNINGKNGLACVTPIRSLQGPIVLRPLPGMPVIRDLIVDLSGFYQQYARAEPYLQPEAAPPSREYLQSPEERAKLDGLYECILCGCCSSACPSYWWNPDKFMGPAALLQAARFVKDSRDGATHTRLAHLNDAYRLLRCRTVMNCADVCPKGLSPAQAIAELRTQIVKQEG